jgi:hypothetical protein
MAHGKIQLQTLTHGYEDCTIGDVFQNVMPQKLCAIVFPWHMGTYKYKRLPMDIKIAQDVFQNVMSKLVQDMEYVDTNK